LFNQKNTWSFQDILDCTRIPKEDCMVHLLSMAHPKVNVLRKKPNNKECQSNHLFQINPNYSNPRAKIDIPVVHAIVPVNVAQQSKEMQQIILGRNNLMDATIVRLMKTRKTLKHVDLVAEVVKVLQKRFVPTPLDIKRRIASLIETEYMKRDEYDGQKYHYYDPPAEITVNPSSSSHSANQSSNYVSNYDSDSESEDTKEADREKIEISRKHQMDAAIVNVMKNKKKNETC